MTLSAVTSSDVRFWPSWPSNSRVRKRPSTKTRLPLRSCSAARSARSPKTLTRNQSVSSIHSPVCWFLRALVDGDAELGHGLAGGRVAHLRVAPEIADDHDLAERHVVTSRQSMAAGAASLSDSSMNSPGIVLVLLVETGRQVLAVDVVELRAVAGAMP